MTPDELVKKLELMKIQVSRKTILRYEQNKLISEPKRGSDGRGKGRFTDYPENTPYEFFASWYWIKNGRKKSKDIAHARELGLQTWHQHEDILLIKENLLNRIDGYYAFQWLHCFLASNPKTENLIQHRELSFYKQLAANRYEFIVKSPLDQGWSKEEILHISSAYEDITGKEI